MSYDLYFWRQTKSCDLSPEEILDDLSEDEPVKGLVAFPRVQVCRIIKKAFPDIEDDELELNWQGAGSYFQINFGHTTEERVHLITVHCGFDLLKSTEIVNRLIDACEKLGCALYDPQVGKRYEQPETDAKIR